MTITSNLTRRNIRKASLWFLFVTSARSSFPFGLENPQDWGNVVAIENVFGYKQVLPLHEGDNLIGRRSKGTEVDIPIETNDPSMDRRHCILNVKRDKQGKVIYTLRDNDSITGTFVMNDLLGPKDRIRLEDGSIFTLGATTLILRAAEEKE